MPGQAFPGPAHDIEHVDADVWSLTIDCCAAGNRWPLVYHGNVGAGKTCAALCLLDVVANYSRYTTVNRLCADVIDVQQGRVEYVSENEFWSRWREVKGLVVVDEIGARERVSDHHYDCVKRAIDEREGKPALFITNLSLDEIASVYDARIASRLAGGTVIKFAGPDRRVKR